MKNNIYIIADFDHTITTGDSKSSWSILETSKMLSKEDLKKCQRYDKYYKKREKYLTINIDEKRKLMEEWANKNLEIFVKNSLKKEEIDKIAQEKNIMKLRSGVNNFFKYLNDNHIPIVIISAGIYDIIKNFLITNQLFNKDVHIIANKIRYENNMIKGFRGKIVHSLCKDKVEMSPTIKKSIEDKDRVLLLGDNIEDTFMIPEHLYKNSIRIGFINGNIKNKKQYEKIFNYVLDDQATFNHVIDIIENETK